MKQSGFSVTLKSRKRSKGIFLLARWVDELQELMRKTMKELK